MKAQIGIPDKNLIKISGILNVLLADEVILSTKTRNYHWNLTGPSFLELHEFFGKQYEKLDEMMDEIAERNRMLGQFSIGTLTEFQKTSRLKEGQSQTTQAKMIQNLLKDHEAIIQAVRKDIDAVDKLGDQGTTDFLTGIMEAHEKMAWMLRAYIS